jgi:MFS family permease
MLAIGTLGMFLSAPGQSFSVAAFIDPMLGDLGLLRTDYSLAYLVAGLVGGALLPGIGVLLDRFGARVLLPTLGLLLGIACLWMSSIGTLLGLSIGFTLIRSIGQGAITLSATWLVGEWFESRRGLAMGIVGLGGAVSVMTIPQLNDLVIEQYGWRSAWWGLAAMVWIGLVLPALLLVRDRPEPLGLLPDARWHDERTSQRSAAARAQEAEAGRADDLKLGQAVRLSSFWKLLAVWCTTSMVGTGLIFHQVSLLAVHDVARNDALLLLGLQAVVATFSGVLAGFLTDMGYERYLLAAAMVFLSSGVGLMLWMPGPGWAVLYGSVLGLQGGIIRTAGTAVWINYYGRTNQGAIRGAAMAAAVVAAACGPLPLAISWDWTGSYSVALSVFGILPLLAGVGVVSARRPGQSAVER